MVAIHSIQTLSTSVFSLRWRADIIFNNDNSVFINWAQLCWSYSSRLNIWQHLKQACKISYSFYCHKVCIESAGWASLQMFVCNIQTPLISALQVLLTSNKCVNGSKQLIEINLRFQKELTIWLHPLKNTAVLFCFFIKTSSGDMVQYEKVVFYPWGVCHFLPTM